MTDELRAAHEALERATRALSDRYAGKVKRTARPAADRMDLAGIEGCLSRIAAARKLQPAAAPSADAGAAQRSLL